MTTIADRLAETTMRPTTLDEVWRRIASEYLVRVLPLPPGLLDIYRGADGLVLYQATGDSNPGALYVVVRYPDGTLVWGSPHR